MSNEKVNEVHYKEIVVLIYLFLFLLIIVMDIQVVTSGMEDIGNDQQHQQVEQAAHPHQHGVARVQQVKSLYVCEHNITITITIRTDILVKLIAARSFS
jgi:hypothetical protein